MTHRTIIVLFTLILLTGCSKNFKEYETLLDPQVSEKAPQKMLVYEVEGDPMKRWVKPLALSSQLFSNSSVPTRWICRPPGRAGPKA